MRWQGIVIHHSASHDASANEIDRWHTERGFAEIGYNFVIRFDGCIEPARDWKKAGAHARGRNTTHLGICLTGHFGNYAPTHEQLVSARRLVKGCMSRYGIPIEKIEPHHQQCPGELFPWVEFIDSLR